MSSGWIHYKVASQLLGDASELESRHPSTSDREKARELRAEASIHATLAQTAATAMAALGSTDTTAAAEWRRVITGGVSQSA